MQPKYVLSLIALAACLALSPARAEETMTPEARRAKWAQTSPEERAAKLAESKAKWEAMSEEEREIKREEIKARRKERLQNRPTEAEAEPTHKAEPKTQDAPPPLPKETEHHEHHGHETKASEPISAPAIPASE